VWFLLGFFTLMSLGGEGWINKGVLFITNFGDGCGRV